MARNPFAPELDADDEALQASVTPKEPVSDDVDLDIQYPDPEAPFFDEKTGTMTIPLPDGSVIVDLSPQRQHSQQSEDHEANLALELDDMVLSRISTDLLEGIGADDDSRSDWLKTREKGYDLLGLKVEQTRSSPDAAGQMEGLSTVRHPLLQEAVFRFQANAYAELCPAAGPAKVVNYGDQNPGEDSLAAALEKDMNYYLTNIATEYYDDTNAMLFDVGFGGMAAKKVYNCPLRRRPVSERVDAQHLIVSNAASNLRNAGRVTHEIRMRKSVLKRMQLLEVYRDIDLGEPNPDYNPVDQKIGKIQGVTIDQTRQEDQDYTLYECYCELDIDGFEHKDEDGHITGLPLPYKVTLEKVSGKILEIRRNWHENDEDLEPQIPFVIFRYIHAMGFYGTGLLHMLGNTTSAITMSWRLMLDAGMFASFPGFLYLQGGQRQTTNEFRIPPGGGMPVRSDATSIRDAIMPLPYREPSPALMQLTDNIAETGHRVGGTAEMPTGEGSQSAPVGTTLALIDQATKVEAAVHKGLHAAQDQEFRLLKELFRADPESLWRGNKRCALGKDVRKTMLALEDCDIVPRADPNVPSRLYRVAKIAAVKQLQAMNPMLYDGKAVDTWALPQLGVDNPEGLFTTQVPENQPDPVAMGKLQLDQQKLMLEHAKLIAQTQNDALNRKSKENLAVLDLAEALAVHPESQAVVANTLGMAPTLEARLDKPENPQGMADGGLVYNVNLSPFQAEIDRQMDDLVEPAPDEYETQEKLRRIAMILENSRRPVFNEDMGAYDVGVI